MQNGNGFVVYLLKTSTGVYNNIFNFYKITVTWYKVGMGILKKLNSSNSSVNTLI